MLNFHAATPEDLSAMGLGKGIYIPAQISRGRGGRKSLYFIRSGERVLQGIFVTSEGLALQYMTRATGRGERAETGDTYIFEITTREGELLWKGEGTLEIIDPSTGQGKLIWKTEGGDDDFIWIFWSFILIVTDP